MKNEEFIKKTFNNFVDQHLTEEELEDLYNGMIADEITRTRVEAHLRRCLICQRRFEFLQEVIAEAEVMEPSEIPEIYYETTQRLLHPTREKLRTLIERLNNLLEEFSFPSIDLPKVQPQAAFVTSDEPTDLELEDGRHGVFMEEDAERNLIVRFDSEEMNLEGTIFRCYVAEEYEQDKIKKVEDNLVGAEVVFKRDKRESLPPGTVPRIEFVDEEGKPHEI